ncbi:MAG: hypothetical protein ACRDCC_09910 [Culicoidibacterales bacterium]
MIVEFENAENEMVKLDLETLVGKAVRVVSLTAIVNLENYIDDYAEPFLIRKNRSYYGEIPLSHYSYRLYMSDNVVTAIDLENESVKIHNTYYGCDYTLGFEFIWVAPDGTCVFEVE